MTAFERRLTPLALERRGEGDMPTAHGYAAVFNRRAHIYGFLEEVAPSAFNKTVQEADVRALFNHSSDMLLGRVRSGTLRLAVDDRGLAYEVDLPATTVGRDVAELLARGDLSGSSFGFRVVNGGETWTETEDGYPLRMLTEVALIDVSPVTWPAYAETDAGIRCALSHLAESRSLPLDALVTAAASDRLADVLADPAPVRRRRRVVA